MNARLVRYAAIMEAARVVPLSVADYLDLEEKSDVRHEYIGGEIHAKHANYRTAQTLEEYVLVAQDRREVTVFRRATGWQGEIYTAPEAVIEFRSIKHTLALAEIYENVF